MCHHDDTSIKCGVWHVNGEKCPRRQSMYLTVYHCGVSPRHHSIGVVTVAVVTMSLSPSNSFVPCRDAL